MKKTLFFSLVLSIIISLASCTESPVRYIDTDPLDNGQGDSLPSFKTTTTQNADGLSIKLEITNNCDNGFTLIPDVNFSYATIKLEDGSGDYYTYYFKEQWSTFFGIDRIGSHNEAEYNFPIFYDRLPKNLKAGTIRCTLQFENCANGGVRQKSSTEKFTL